MTSFSRPFSSICRGGRLSRTALASVVVLASWAVGCSNASDDDFSFEDDAASPDTPGPSPDGDDSSGDDSSGEDDGSDSPGGGDDWLAAQGWTNVPIGDVSGTATIEFDLRADASPVNAVAGLARGTATDYSDLSMIARLNPDGRIDVRDGDAYAADENVPYLSGVVYHVVIDADLARGRYSVAVEREGQSVALRTDAAFRTDREVTSVDRLVLYEVESLAAVRNLTIDGVPVPLVAEDDDSPPPPSDDSPVPSGGLWSVDFQQSAIGPYTDDRVRADWQGTRWTNTNGRVEVRDEAGNRFVRVAFPEGGVGPREGGAQWMVDFAPFRGRTYDRLYVSYRLRFRPGFDFVRGGKLPGLVGGEANTGGERPNGSDGWSGRMMWRREGAAVQYLYHPDQPGTYGEDLEWTVPGDGVFSRGEWITVEHLIVMNTPGQNDGFVRGWYNGVPALERTGVRFRDLDGFAIDGFMFSTFFGGSGPDWAPTRDEYIDFDDFVFSDQPITH